MISSIIKNSKSSIQNLRQHSGFMKYFKNTSWLFGEKILRMIVGLFVGIWVARYLGPEQFGLFSYAQSFVGLFTAFATLGLDGIVVRELVHDESRRDELIGTAFWLKLMGAFTVLVILAIAVNFTSNDHSTNIMVFIIASATIFQSFNVVDMYFQSKVMGKYITYANVISLLLSSIVKIALILCNAPLIAFVWTIVFDSFVLACGFIYYYIKINSKLKIKNLKFNKSTAVDLLRDSWPLIISGISIGFGMRFDQIFIKEMINSNAVGLYSAGVKLAESMSVVPMVITQSIFPKIFQIRKEKKKTKIINIFRIIFYFLFFISFIILFFSPTIVELLYGDKYIDSSLILAILIFSIPMTFLNIMTSQLLLIENLQSIIMKRQILLVVCNIVLNIVLIPRYGIIGAACATLLSDTIIGLFIDIFDKQTQHIFYLKIDAIFFTQFTKKYQ